MLAKAPSRLETVSDVDGDLIFWQVLRERPAELQRVCALTPHARAEHQAASIALLAARAAVVVSGYPSLYERLYAGWDRVDIPTTIGQGGTRQDRIEVLWSNRLLSAQSDLFADTDEVLPGVGSG